VGYEVEIKVKKAQYHELEEMAHQIGFPPDLQTKVNLHDAKERCQAQFDKLILD